MPNDKKILPIFGQDIANQAFKQAIESKSKDKDFFHKSIAQALKNSNGEEIEKLNQELIRLTGKPLRAVDILTNPIYFDTPTYQKLAERSDKEFHIAENTDFAKFYHDFKDGRLVGKSDDEIKATIKEFLEGTGEAFSIGAKSEINISDLDKLAIKKALENVNSEGKLDRENLKKALDPAYTQVKGMLVGDVNLKQLDMKALLTFQKPQVTDSLAPSQVVKSNNTPTNTSAAPSMIQRVGKAFLAFFKNGFSIQAAKTAYLEGTSPNLPNSSAAVSNFLPTNTEVATPKQRMDMAEKLGNMLSPINLSKKDDPTVDLVSPYKNVNFSLSTAKMGMPPLIKDTPEIVKSNLLNFLNTFEAKGKELSHIQQQLGQAVLQIASGAEPTNVIKSLERSIQVVKEDFGVKEPESIKVLNNLEKKLADFKDRTAKLEIPSTEPKQTTEPVIPHSKPSKI